VVIDCLEFSAELPESAARGWLDEVGPILQRVHVRLADRNSRFAAPLRVLLRLICLEPQPASLTRMAAEEERDDTRAALDRAWMEVPVTFGPDQPAIHCGASAQPPAEKTVQWTDYRDTAGNSRG